MQHVDYQPITKCDYFRSEHFKEKVTYFKFLFRSPRAVLIIKQLECKHF